MTELEQLSAPQTALLLVDVQLDYLQHSQLQPAATALIGALAALLKTCRQAKIPVLHARTLIAPDGTHAMPHRRSGLRRCVVGTPGAEPPAALAARAHETVLRKDFFSAFSNAELQTLLQQQGTRSLIIAGLYTHACIQASVLDAYQRGYTVYLPQDGLASPEPLHAALTLKWLHERACCVTSVAALQTQLQPGGFRSPQRRLGERFPVACINGNWLPASDEDHWIQRNPAHWDTVLGTVPLAREKYVSQASQALAEACPGWQQESQAERARLLRRWQASLAQRREQLCALLILEVGKPLREAQAEYTYAQNLLHTCIEHLLAEPLSAGRMCYRPWGTVGLITPWNNPLAIPVGKIAPALAYGNTVLWKPALQTPRLVRLLCESLLAAGLPPQILGIVFGDADTGRVLAAQPEIAAISFTGSTQAGQELALVCAASGKAFQAEMGGNNAVIISASADIAEVARTLAPAVYSFAGQRCTAPRRLIVPATEAERFSAAFIAATQPLQPGPLDSLETRLAPLISRDKQQAVAQQIAASLQAGGQILQGGFIPKAYATGCWYAPTLVSDLSPEAALVQQESFAPVAVLLKSRDFQHALALSNAVAQGLSASLYTQDPEEQACFLRQAQAGILRVNTAQAVFDPDAPFGGWKASGLGIPEHGRWDRQFYTRPQAHYQADAYHGV